MFACALRKSCVVLVACATITTVVGCGAASKLVPAIAQTAAGHFGTKTGSAGNGIGSVIGAANLPLPGIAGKGVGGAVGNVAANLGGNLVASHLQKQAETKAESKPVAHNITAHAE